MLDTFIEHHALRCYTHSGGRKRISCSNTFSYASRTGRNADHNQRWKLETHPHQRSDECSAITSGM